VQVGFSRRPLRTGDGIIAINGINVCGLDRDQTVAKLHACGQIITLTTLCRQGHSHPPPLIGFTREESPSYELKMLQHDITYVAQAGALLVTVGGLLLLLFCFCLVFFFGGGGVVPANLYCHC